MKIYAVVPDEEAEREGDLRVVDESGEDYVFSVDRFVAIEVPSAVRASLLKAFQRPNLATKPGSHYRRFHLRHCIERCRRRRRAVLK
jgi:hypothetical protein